MICCHENICFVTIFLFSFFFKSIIGYNYQKIIYFFLKILGQSQCPCLWRYEARNLVINVQPSNHALYHFHSRMDHFSTTLEPYINFLSLYSPTFGQFQVGLQNAEFKFSKCLPQYSPFDFVSLLRPALRQVVVLNIMIRDCDAYLIFCLHKL